MTENGIPHGICDNPTLQRDNVGILVTDVNARVIIEKSVIVLSVYNLYSSYSIILKNMSGGIDYLYTTVNHSVGFQLN